MNERIHKVVTVVGGAGVVVLLYAVLALMLLPKGGLQKKREALWKQETTVPSDPTDFPTVKGRMSKPIDLEAAFAPSEEALEKGKTLFTANCAACHGPDGRGDGPAAVALNPKPRNFTSPQGWTNGYTLADIFRTLSKGVPGTGMAAFDTLSPTDRFELAHYVQSFGRFDHGADTPAQVAALDKEFSLSTGVQEPNKVAVWKVMQDMARDFKAPPAFGTPPEGGGGEGAELFRTMVRDPARLSAVLAQLPDWRTNVQALVAVAVADPRGCGLDPAVATLDLGRWKALQGQLEGLAPAPAAGVKKKA